MLGEQEREGGAERAEGCRSDHLKGPEPSHGGGPRANQCAGRTGVWRVKVRLRGQPSVNSQWEEPSLGPTVGRRLEVDERDGVDQDVRETAFYGREV